MVSWQDLKEYGLNIYKKQPRSRVLWIGGSSSVFGLFALLLMLTGMSYTYSGDSYVNEGIGEAYVNITSTYWRVCFDDTFEFVSTNPKVKTEVYVPARGIGNWRLFNATKDCIERYTLSNQLPNRFKIVGYGIKETTKWSVNIDTAYTPEVDIDPLWLVADGIIKNCVPVYEDIEQKEPNYELKTYDNKTTRNEIVSYNSTIIKTQVSCITDDYIQLKGDKYYYERQGFKCSGIGSTIECDRGGRDPAIANGKCDAGEQDCIIITTGSGKIESKKSDTFDLNTGDAWLNSKQ